MALQIVPVERHESSSNQIEIMILVKWSVLKRMDIIHFLLASSTDDSIKLKDHFLELNSIKIATFPFHYQ